MTEKFNNNPTTYSARALRAERRAALGSFLPSAADLYPELVESPVTPGYRPMSNRLRNSVMGILFLTAAVGMGNQLVQPQGVQAGSNERQTQSQQLAKPLASG